MNTLRISPDVRLFVEAIRERLADLTEEEREELVGGLEADVADLVAERGVEALPDPSAYAAELRAAAGLAPEGAPGAVVLDHRTRDALMAWLDRGSATWRLWVEGGDHLGLPALATALRPVWWVVRGLCAAALLTEIYSSQMVFGFTPRRALVAAVLVLVSVQVGRDAWWPGTRLSRSLVARLLLGAANVGALVLVPVMADRFLVAKPVHEWIGSSAQGFTQGRADEGLYFAGSPVGNIYPYDAQGHPLTGVQLVDQDGRRLLLPRGQYGDSGLEALLSPWHDGRTELYSVFPLPERAVDPDTGRPLGDARLQTPPFASLPPVTLDGVTPSRVARATGDSDKSARKGVPTTTSGKTH